jgi:GNAT superfamily N-acetyltransferase
MCELPFISPDLAYRIEMASAWRGVRYAEAYQKLHSGARSSTIAVAGGFATFISPGSPVNRAGGLGLQGPVLARDMDTLEAFFFSRGARPRVHACPLADESLLDLLHDGGYRLSSFFSVLVFPIAENYQPAPLPEDMRISPAEPHQSDLWLRVVGQGFEEQEEPSPEAIDILGPNFHAADGLPFFAWVGGDPAGGGGMYYNLEQRVVELGGASTRPVYRRRGIQRVLIEARLAAARALGCDLAVVLTEPGSISQRNLERAGFQLAYTKVVMEK